VRCTKKGAQVAIGLAGGYVGHTVASCRSLSDPETHQGGPGHFAWPRVPHPSVVGPQATIAALRAAVQSAGGADKVLGFVYELVQERTGAVLSGEFLCMLAGLRTELELPLIAVENTTAMYRSGKGPFLSTAIGLTPDVLAWWGGGQTGYVHCTAKWFVPGPLTLVSTWDGDELSMVRHHHQLRAARRLDIAGASEALDRALAGADAAGLGAYRVVRASSRVADVLAERGIALRRFPNGRLGIVPALDQIEAAAASLQGVSWS